MPASVPYTAAMVRDLPDDGRRYEVVDGRLLVTRSPGRPHQRAVAELHLALASYVRGSGIGEVVLSPSDVQLDERSLVQPDLFVEGLLGGEVADGWNSGAPLLLCIEVLSPATARTDRTLKRRRYQRAGVPETWVVDVEARAIERWRPDDRRPDVLREWLTWQPAGAATPLALDLAWLFARIHREAR